MVHGSGALVTDSIAVIIPDRRYTKVRDTDGHVAGRLEKVELHADGLPVTPRVFPAHSGEPRPAYVHVANDDRPQFPEWGGLTTSDRIGIAACVILAAAGLLASWVGMWMMMTR
jgi:hypothetical protein